MLAHGLEGWHDLTVLDPARIGRSLELRYIVALDHGIGPTAVVPHPEINDLLRRPHIGLHPVD